MSGFSWTKNGSYKYWVVLFTDSYPLSPAMGDELASTYLTLMVTKVTCVLYLSMDTSLMQRHGTPKEDTWICTQTSRVWGIYVLRARSQEMGGWSWWVNLPFHSSGRQLHSSSEGSSIQTHSGCLLSHSFLFRFSPLPVSFSSFLNQVSSVWLHAIKQVI